MTLIELLVVIAMIFIMTGVTLVNFRHFGRLFDVERAIGHMAQEVRASLAMSMAMKDYNIPVGCTGSNTIVSYGVNFQVGAGFYNRMVYFIEGDPAHLNFGGNICSPIIVERINLEQGLISLIRVFSKTSSSSVTGLDIIFTPPHPRTYIGSIVVTGGRWRSQHDVAEISVSLPETGDARTIRVNRAGMIKIIQPGS